MKKIWITWERQRRNRELSKALNVELFELYEIDNIKNYFLKYYTGIYKTIKILLKEKPQIVFCQNPSLVLAFFMTMTKKIFKTRVCVDAHNAGLFPAEGKSRFLLLLARIVQKCADITIVTNKNLQVFVEKNGGRGVVLPDRIPTFFNTRTLQLKGRLNLLFICTFSSDEPYQAVFDAAAELPEDFIIYVTGNYRKKHIEPKNLPPNVILTGFVPEKEFLDLLNSVDATIDLTTRENCLVCGAYETVAVEKILIISDTAALREYFQRGAVYVDNTASGIRRGIEIVNSKRKILQKEVVELKSFLNADWDNKRAVLETTIKSWSAGG
ncbi:MAG: hypothetical protein R2940_10960 [Syntrophotaleaceae bacterium]